MDYKVYEQLCENLNHHIIILDLIFNIDATKFIKSFTQ